MFDVLMYLFETYIHTEADCVWIKTNLNRILPTQDLIERYLQCPALAGKACGLSGRTGEPMQLASDPLSMRIYTPEEWKDWMPVVVVFCFSLSKFRC